MTQHRFFQRLVVVNLIALGAVLLFCVFSIISPSAKQEEAYRQLMSRAENSRKESKTTPYNAKQERTGILKQVFFMEGANRQQLKLFATEAQLVFDHRSNEQTEIVENMKNVKCLMQEELFYQLPDGREAVAQLDGRLLIKHEDPKDPESWLAKDTPGLKPMQIVRYMEADKASYFYSNDKFVANQVNLSRHVLPGHQMVATIDKKMKPMMSGVAESVEFSMSGQLNFKATNMKASFRGSL